MVKKEKSDAEIIDEIVGKPYIPPNSGSSAKRAPMSTRSENPVIFLEIGTCGGTTLIDGSISRPRTFGRLYFELRNDMVPVACANFLGLGPLANYNLRS